MRLPDLIKKAVLTEDWKLICTAYKAITGEDLSPPAKKPVVDFSNLEIPDELLGEAEEDDEEEELDIPVEGEEEEEAPSNIITDVAEAQAEIARARKKKVDDFTMPQTNRGGQKVNEDGELEARKESMRIPKNRPNKFKDDLRKESADLKKNNVNLQKLYSTASTRTSRVEKEERVDTGAQVDVVCSLCDKPETVAAAMAIGHSLDPSNNTYRCNSCSTPAGRARALREKRAKEMAGR